MTENSLTADQTDTDGQTALTLAAAYGRSDIVKMLLEYRADAGETEDREQSKAAKKFAALVKAKNKELGLAEAEEQEQWLEDTDFSKGLKREMTTPRALKPPSPKF